MGTILASAIIAKASTQLIDPTNTRWTVSEMLGWLSDGQRAICALKPNSNNKVAVIPMVSGTKQTIPSDGWFLLGVYRNMGTTGTTPGAVVRISSRELMDAFNPNWHFDPAATAVEDYVFDLQDQTVFYVYPPSDGTGYIEINYAAIPVELASSSTPIQLADIFEPLLLDYVLYRANAKDAGYAPGLQLSSAYYQSFMAAVTGKDTAELQSNPNLGLAPFNPQIRGEAT